MESIDRARIKQHARILKAVASEPRLVIVDRLNRGECCVCDIAELIGADQSTASRHLAILRDGGIVDAERRGNHVYYRLTAPCVLGFLECAARVLEERGRGSDDEA